MKLTRLALAVPVLALVAACGTDASGASDTDRAASRSAGSLTSPETGGSIAPGQPALPGEDRSTASMLAPDADPLTDGVTAADGTATAGGSQADEAASSGRVSQPAVISTGQVSLEATDLDKVRFSLQKLLDQWNGTIANEEARSDDSGKTARERLELRVPSKYFDEAMDEISGLATLIDRNRSSEDVTTQVIDVAARVRSQRLSLARIQALMNQARDLNQVIAIEGQLSRRQAALDSLEQQQSYLADQTSLSTINVYLTTPEKKKAAARTDRAGGFWSGLETGWTHLRDTTTSVLTGVGTALPFAAVLALLAVLGRLALRRLGLSGGWTRARDRSAA